MGRRRTPSETRVQVSRVLFTTLSLLLVAVAVQFTAIAPSDVRWVIVSVLLFLAATVAVCVALSLKMLDSGSLNDLTKERDTIPGIITYFATRSVWITTALALALLAGTGISAYWTSQIWPPPGPAGAFVRSRHGTLAGSSGQYLVGLRNVQNVSSDLVWFEVAVPEYETQYARTYLYYYTQAPAQFESPGSYDAIVDIVNSGRAPTTEIITAFACSSGNTHIEAGATHPEIRKQAGCSSLDHICVRLPACQHSGNCSKGRDDFTLPPECKKSSPVWVKLVSRNAIFSAPLSARP